MGLVLVLGWLVLAPATGAQGSFAAAPAVPIRVTLVSPTGAPLAGEGHIVFLGTGSEPPLVHPVKLPAAAAARLPAGSQWTVRADFPGYFAATSLLRVPESPSSPVDLTVALRPAGLLTGTFSLKEAKDKPPEKLEVRFEPVREGPPQTKEVPAGGGVCAISPERKWRCTVPAGRLDITLHARGFVPHYLWKVSIAAGETKSLRNLVLSRGASVAGWVALEDGTPPKVCTVRLQPAEAPGPGNDPVLRLLRKAAIEAPCQPGGFFQLAGVAAGSHALVAESGGARAALSPLEVWDGAESRLENPLVLKLPVDLALQLAPATDWMGRPWRVKAHRASDYRAGWEEPPIRAEARADGRVSLRAQSPGQFWITVYDWAGNAVYSETHELSDPAQAYFIPLQLLWLEGRVRLGDEPLQGRLYFGGRSGATRITMESDADGRFEGPLPRDGQWRVDVESDEPLLKTAVWAQVRRDGSEASVAIELPGTRVQGRVVDSDGNSAAGADVALDTAVGTITMRSDAKGEFEFRAFPEGTTALSADKRAAAGGREQSETHMFEASEDAAHGPVVLTLQRNVAVRGRVLAAAGPVIGAMVYAWPSAGGSVSTVRTRADGSFEVKLPERTSTAHLVVSPPGGKLKAYEVRLAGGEEVVLPVGAEGGELLVDLNRRDAAGAEIFALWQDEVPIPFGVLATWTQGNGVPFKEEPRLRLPELAAGSYTVCFGSPQLVEDDKSWRERARCASGYLAAGSTLELRLP